ncbi:MAG: SRPBCC family protein [Chitinophagales bacterium]
MLGTILLILAGIFAAIVLAGIFIPSKYKISKRIDIAADSRDVYQQIDDLETWGTWSAWNPHNDPHITITFGDKRNGKGAKLFWKGKKMGRGDMEIKDTTPYKEIQIACIFNKGLFKMDFTFFIEPADKNTTSVIWQVSGRTRRGGFAKILGQLLPRWMGKDMETSLIALKHYCEGTLA